MKTVRFLHLWLPPAAFMALLFLVSSTGDLMLPLAFPDKLLHLAAYTVLGLLFLRALHGGIPNALRLLPVSLAVVCTAAYGGLDEFYQGFVDGRIRDPYDFAADLAGALLATVLLAAWIKCFRGRP